MDDTQIETPENPQATPTSSESPKQDSTKPATVIETLESVPHFGAQTLAAAAEKHAAATKKHTHSKKPDKAKAKKSKKYAKYVSSSSSRSSSRVEEDSDDESDFSSSSSSEDESARKKKQKSKKLKQKKKSKHSKHRDSSDETISESEKSDISDSEESDEDDRRGRRTRNRKKRSRRHERIYDDELLSEEEELDRHDRAARLNEIMAGLQHRRSGRALSGGLGGLAGLGGRYGRAPRDPPAAYKANRHLLLPPSEYDSDSGTPPPRKGRSSRKSKRSHKPKYKRVDEIWDSTIHNYRLVDSVEAEADQYETCVFTVRRMFDWDNKPKQTVVDIRSKLLRDALKDVWKDVKGMVLDGEKPAVDPNMLYLYIDELRDYTNKGLKSKLKSAKKRKEKKSLILARKHCKVLISYLETDYKETRKTLKGLLKAGEITFELLWALFKPNSIAFTPTYGQADVPRCFKVDYAHKLNSFMRGEWYMIEGRYLEYNGKHFGLGDFDVDVDNFKGPRKITSLSCYPIQYHKDAEVLTKQLVDRGKKFVSLVGMNFKAAKGLAFSKRKKGVAKFNINGRIIIDPLTFRRINANYPIGPIKREEDDEDDQVSDDECSDDSGCGDDSGEEKDQTKPTKRWKAVRDGKLHHMVRVDIDGNGKESHVENLDKFSKHGFTEEELLIASPVVFGFALGEKAWLEFSVSSIKEIEWNEGAFESLVLPPSQKSIVQALVKAHKYEAARTIDDVVQGKGKGLIAVLHCPPGTGKTLTAEGIAELLHCPLYMISVGELGTDAARLEETLNRILDLAHTWGAILLFDEADVFLERRQHTDIHRNALISVFLRLLEYFQGILFLTTNRVETFDEAFQSRIHLALKYGELSPKARKSVWKMFIERVRTTEEAKVEAAKTKKDAVEIKETARDGASDAVPNEASAARTPAVALEQSPPFTEADYDILARRVLNGRQIKNVARTAQALSLNEGKTMGMEHVKRVLEVQEAFENDLKGGSGFQEAMRSYT